MSRRSRKRCLLKEVRVSKFFKLLFLVTLGAIVVIGCERQLVSPIHTIDSSQTTAQFAQNALSDLADTAAEHGFIGLANAASGVAEVLAIDDGTTSVQPTFSKLVELADNASAFELAFVDSGCEIGMHKFAEASMDAVKAYTIRDTAEMEQALQHLAQGAIAIQTALQQLPAHNSFTPFAFGYNGGNSYYSLKPYSYMDAPQEYPTGSSYGYMLGAINIEYDDEGTLPETRETVIEFLTSKGYDVRNLSPDGIGLYDQISLDAPIDPILLGAELINIPGVVSVTPARFSHIMPAIATPPHISRKIIRQVAARYNQAWCQGTLDAGTVDSILIEESGLDFFDYAFVRNLANIYAEEIPEAAERIRTNRFCLHSIVILFLEVYSPSSGHISESKKTHNEIIEAFRQEVRYGIMSIELRTVLHFYRSTDYWKQLVADHLNNNGG